jgi:thiol:disulfide interchange protein DsbA
MAQYKEGTHYEIIKPTATAKPEVLEFFSYFCPHCYSFEPIIKQLQESLPEGIKVTKNHVVFLGGAMGEELTRAYATARILKVDETMSAVLFDAIQRQRLNVNSRQDIRDLFVANGVDGAQFDAAVDSFVVNGQVAQMIRNAQNYKISGVPTVVVNGKYKVMVGSWIKSTEDYTGLVAYLTTLK